MRVSRVVPDRRAAAAFLLSVCLLGADLLPSRPAEPAPSERVDAEARAAYLELAQRIDELVGRMSADQCARAGDHAAELRAKAEAFYREDAESFARFQDREREALARMKRGERRLPPGPAPEEGTAAAPAAPPAPPVPEPEPDRLQPTEPESEIKRPEAPPIPGPEPAEEGAPGAIVPAAEAPLAPRVQSGERQGSLPRGDREVLLAEGVRRFSRAMEEASRKHSLRPSFLLCVMRIESAYDTRAVSRAGALGLMQLMPATAEDLGVNPYDLHENILGGARLIDENLRLYGEDVTLAMAAYNAGRGAVAEHGGVPPYRETQEYVARVERSCGEPRP